MLKKVSQTVQGTVLPFFLLDQGPPGRCRHHDHHVVWTSCCCGHLFLQSLETNTVFITSEKNKTKINTTTKVHNLITSQLKVPSCQNLFHRPHPGTKCHRPCQRSKSDPFEPRYMYINLYTYRVLEKNFRAQQSSTLLRSRIEQSPSPPLGNPFGCHCVEPLSTHWHLGV